MKKMRSLLAVCTVFLIAGCALGQFPVPQNNAVMITEVAPDVVDEQNLATPIFQPVPAEWSVIQPEELVYLGAFRLPDESGTSSWDYSGRGLTFYPEGDANGAADGFSGSLFGVGHDQQNHVSEIDIPAPVISKNLDDLNTAATLQPFADITGGLFPETDLPRLGIQYLPPLPGQTTGKLHFVHGGHIQYFEPSHGWAELTLNNPQAKGAWVLEGFTNYVTSDYLFEIPPFYSALIAGAPRLVTGRYREGVWGGNGPTLFAYTLPDYANPPGRNASITSITPLLLYGIQEAQMTDITSDERMQMQGHNDDDSWWGGAWLTDKDNTAVIFTGTKAVGESWYGFANGVVWAYDCAEQTPPTCPDVPDFPYDGRGFWAEGYYPAILFYNPADLIAVANQEAPTWQPQPYAILDLSPYFFDPQINIIDYKTDIAGAVAYDRQNGLLYIIERLADGYKSVIHVFHIASQ